MTGLDPPILSVLIAVVGLLIEAAVLVVGAVWAVGKINTQVAVFSETIRALRDAVDELRSVVKLTDTRVDRHDVKITEVEGRIKALEADAA